MTRYVNALPHAERLEIARRLVLAGISGEDLARAMNGRVCDLEDTIDTTPWR